MGMDKYFHPKLHLACNYLTMLRLKLSHVIKSAPDAVQFSQDFQKLVQNMLMSDQHFVNKNLSKLSIQTTTHMDIII